MIYGTQEFADKIKAIIKDGLRHSLYEETVKHAEAMGVHIYGDKPVYLLERARPREDEDVKTYRLENYEPTTKAGADKAIDIVSKGFNPTLYSIVWKEQNEKTKKLQGYTLEYYPTYNSVISYDKDVLLRRMLSDPNSVIAEKPSEIPENDTIMIEPVSIIYGSSAVWWYDRDCFLIYLRKEVRDSTEYYYFAYYDKNQYISFETWYNGADHNIYFEEEEKPYVHNFKEIPCWFLRGKSKSLDNGDIMYESYFSSALPHWNLAVTHESDLLGAFINHMHPIKTVWTDECQHEFRKDDLLFHCIHGVMKAQGGVQHDWNGTDCPSCGGSGRKAVTSPYGEYLISTSKLNEGNSPAGLKPVEYVIIPTEATKLLSERCDKVNKRAMWAINMDVEDEVGAVQSGVAKTIDRSGQSDTIYNIISTVFDVHITNQFYFKNKYMFAIQARSENKKEDVNLPEINKPTSFDILTTSERIYNFSVAQKSGADKNYLRAKQIEIDATDFSTSPDVKNYLMTMHKIDPLFGFIQDEISAGVMSGVIRKEDWAIHENLKPFMDKAIQANDKFLSLTTEEQLAIMETFAGDLIKAAKPKVDVSMVLNPGVGAAA